MQVINGPYGPYISAHGTNVRLPRGTKPETLTFEAIQALIQKSKEAPAKPRRTRTKKS